MAYKPLVSIIILTYSGERTIKETIDSVLAQDYENSEIIIVDNASTDKTLGIIREYGQKPVLADQARFRVCSNETNIGFSGGHNRGISESRGEFVLCINQDVTLNSNFISEALAVFELDGKIGAVQPKMINKNDRAIIDSTGIMIYKSRRMVDRGQGEENKGQYEKTEEVFGANGAAVFFRKACLEDACLRGRSSETLRGTTPENPRGYGEYWDEDFFIYKEDVDLSWRIRLYGWKIMYCPKAIVYTDRTSKPINEKDGVARMIKTRREQKQYVRYYSFKNHRLNLIKNDLPWLFFKHLPWILPREIGAWLYVLIFEPKTWSAIGELFKQMPRAWRKRKIIMKNKKAGNREMGKWFV